MTVNRVARAAALALALLGAAAAPAWGQAETMLSGVDETAAAPPDGAEAEDGEPDAAEESEGISEPIGAAAFYSMFPYATPAEPAAAAAPQNAAFIEAQRRVRVRSTPAPDREGLILFGISDRDPAKSHINASFGGISNAGGFTLGLDLTTADAIDGVELYADAALSFLRFYRRFEVGAIFGDLSEEGIVGYTRFRYTRRNQDRFFGLGPTSEKDFQFDPAFSPAIYGGQTNIDREDRELQGAVWYNSARVETGIFAEVGSHSVYEGNDDNDPSVFSLYQPYFSGLDCLSPVFPRNAVPGLLGGRMFGYGAFFEYEGRNWYYGLPQGVYLYAKIGSYDGLNDDADAAGYPGDPYDFGWVEGLIDARAYLPIGGPKTSFAFRFQTELTERKGGSAIPYWRLPTLGGGTSLRGFQTFRFRGENSILFQAELRRTIWEKEGQGFDIAFFGDLGQVWGYGYCRDCVRDVTGFDPKVGDDFDPDQYEADFGVGGSYRLSQAFSLRLDFAHSNEGNRVRLGFSAGF